MSILDDISVAMREAERPPIGIELGISAKPAFYAAAAWVREHGSAPQRESLTSILGLARTHSTQFDGWALILSKRNRRRAA